MEQQRQRKQYLLADLLRQIYVDWPDPKSRSCSLSGDQEISIGSLNRNQLKAMKVEQLEKFVHQLHGQLARKNESLMRSLRERDGHQQTQQSMFAWLDRLARSQCLITIGE
ncbi:hypothetical protein BLA29_011367 [Euroglyphus maynei]|uniref:Schwannomin interacting protein 1 C-terminal domain-containing protein n=1 Tax=Euroglyphus maynei TaxID=6958 RepID=A0A1Y3BM32_EURMA|nr:hypothetical protein BLA29_011367 [Euroglyphus maynei]